MKIKKNLFNKLLGTYALVTLLSIVIVSIFFYIFFSQYYFNVKEQQLLTQGTEISNILSPYIKNKEIEKVNELVDNFNKINISHMWIVDKSNTIISGKTSQSHELSHADELTHADELCPNSNQVERALKGEVVYNKGIIKFVNEPVLSVALPIYVGDKVEAAIFVCNPLSDIINSIMQTFKIVIIAGVIAIFISVFVSYFISMSIAKPIKEITEISLEMSKGNFSKKAKVYSSDEIGKLTEAFNYMMVTLDKTMGDLEDEKNKMIKLEKMQRQFVANASHEIRTPLTSVRGYVEAILDGVVNDKEQERKHLGIILKETLRMHRLVNSLLDLSRIESRQIKINRKDLNISEVINSTVMKFKPIIEDQELQLVVDIPKGLPIVIGDEDLIDQVITNYITNAVRFTSAGGSITVKAEQNENEVYVHVIDTGIGISSEELTKVWGRFYKINESRQLSKEGAGLGLSLVKEIIELLGGRTWAESELGKGSIFSFSLIIS
ncbi:two-component sensor histidine kinase [Clostridium butyricum]|uniref:histidine kinase n=1 Tax=Clostridium butyricum TaxID=1492 RepID=A0A512TSG4_CLOBU|nr:ATP-binding protein [Clostridium butyricum]NOW22737.1 signal transduction histidine kinase [Clostridium butyricum]GEQ23175.1 two-component sensor histidine kinase [Clostridium butyricum]